MFSTIFPAGVLDGAPGSGPGSEVRILWLYPNAVSRNRNSYRVSRIVRISQAGPSPEEDSNSWMPSGVSSHSTVRFRQSSLKAQSRLIRGQSYLTHILIGSYDPDSPHEIGWPIKVLPCEPEWAMKSECCQWMVAAFAAFEEYVG